MALARVASVLIVLAATGDALAQDVDGTPTVSGTANGGPTSSEITAEEPLRPWRRVVDAPPPDNDSELAPHDAFEIGLQGGVTLPFGSITGSRRIADIVDAGGAVGLSLGYRISPHWAFGWTGTFHESSGDDTFVEDIAIRGGTSGVFGTFHVRPYTTVDPYITIGGGYRGLWLLPEGEPTRVLHGFEVAKLAVGMDFRVSPSFAFGPELGADLNLMLWEDMSDTAGGNALDDPGLTTFIFAGAQGRFDVGGTRLTSSGEPATQTAQAELPR